MTRTRTKRMLQALAAAAAAVLVAGAAYAASTAQVPDYSWYRGHEADTSYQVNTPGKLRALANLVNGVADYDDDGAYDSPAVSFAGKTITQTGDIGLGGEEFAPIGSPDHPFEGTFAVGTDRFGNQRTVYGLSITKGSAYVGLFGYCGPSSKIEGVHIVNSGSISRIALGTPAPATAFDGSAAADPRLGLGSVDVDANSVIHDVGSVVGYTAGAIASCESEAEVVIENVLQATNENPLVVANIGGMAGTVEGDVTDCRFAGDIDVTAPSLASDSNDAVVANVGGVVGTAGAANEDGRSARAGVVSGCSNGFADDSGRFDMGGVQSVVHVMTTGVGGLDRFGVQKEATSLSVGGIVGYGFGAIRDCSNYGMVNTNSVAATLYKDSSAAQAVHLVKPDDTRPAEYPEAQSLFKIANGGSAVGGIVGTLRDDGLGLAAQSRTDIGDSAGAIALTGCFDTGMVVGLARTGGIAGAVGSYADIDSCRNGKTDTASGSGVAADNGHVVTTRWNKPMTGGIAGTTYSNISNCANLAEIENIQTGYYTAGIVGGLYSPASYTSEVFACFNTGQVHVASYATQSYREAGLVGNNAGYLHDSVMRSGCVLSHDDGEAAYPNSAIGDDSWGAWSNVKFITASNLKKSESAAVLNASHAADVLTHPESEWVYWYIKGGYPTLNTWDAPADRAQLTSANVAASCVELAEFAGTVEAIPTLVVMFTDDKGEQIKLVQNVDFYAVPQEGAVAQTGDALNDTPYAATIVGIGNYEGWVSDVCSYGIGPCDLKNCEVSTTIEKYNFGVPVYPEAVYVRNPAGALLDEADFRYEIYGGSTLTLTGAKQGNYVVFDSAGFVSWDGGTTRAPVADAAERAKLTGDLTGVDYVLYDADGARIYEVSEGGTVRRTYDPVSGQQVSSSGPVAYKRAVEGVKGGGLAGYIVKVSAAAGTKNLKKSSWTSGQYVIEAIDLYRDAEIEQVTLDVPDADGAGSTTRTWLWSSEKSTLYEPKRDAKGELVRDTQGKLQPAVDADGNPVEARVTFTGGELHPKMTISFTKENGERVELVEDRANGYTLIYGDPYTTKQDLEYVNRDATPRVEGDGWAAAEDATEDEKKAAEELAEQLAGHEKAAVTARSILGDKLTNYVHLYFPIDPAGLDECRLVLGGADISSDVAAGTDALLAEHDAAKLPSFAYRDGYGVRPSVVLKRCGNTLVEGVDYEVEFANNVNKTTDEALQAYAETGDVSGLASVTVRGLGNVRGSYTGYFAIAGGKSLAAAYRIEPIPDQPYNLGYEVRPPAGVHLVKLDPATGETMLDAQGAPVRADDMVEGRDYSVTYEDLNTSASSTANNFYGAKVFVRGINEYTGLLSTSFETEPLDLSDPANAWRLGPWQYRVATDENEAVPAIIAYTALSRKMYPIVDWGAYDPETGGGIDESVYAWTAGPLKFENRDTGKVYAWDTAATATPESPLPGDYDATVDYSRGSQGDDLCGTETFAVKLAKYDLARFLSNAANPFRCDAQTYDGSAHEPVRGVQDGWTIAYENNVEAGTARFTVTAPEDDAYYAGTYVGSFQINALDLADAQVRVADQLYTGRALEPAVRVSAGDVRLVEGRDFEVSYANNTSKGTATAVVRGIGSCEGRVDAQFKIGNYLNIAQADFAPVLDQLYTGRAVEPALDVMFDDGLGAGPVALAAGVDYTLSYENNVAESTDKAPATITVTGKGRFANSKTTVTFNIVKARDIAGATCEIPDQVYTGAPIEPELSVTYGGAALRVGTDYEVSYRRNVKAGASARAVLTGKGTFTGTLSVPFNIVVKADGSQAGDLAAAGIGTLTRFGADAADAPAFAIAVAEDQYPGAIEGAVVAWKKDYAGQLLACSLARALDWPVLLANRDGVSGGVRTFVAEHGVSRAIVVGGEDAVSARAVAALESRGLSVERVAGADTAATSALVASRVAGADTSGDVVLANPDDVEGAAALAAWAAARGVPLLYANDGGTVSDDVACWLGGCTRLIVAGGYEKVDASVADRVSGECQVVRLAGADRYAECAAIARFALTEGSTADGALFANASSLSGQIAACTLAAEHGVPLAVVASGHLDTARVIAAGSAVYRGVALGGDLQFSDALCTSVAKELSW